MSIGNLAHHFRSQLKERGAQTAQALESAHAQMVQSTQPRLDQLYRDIATMRAEAGTNEQENTAPTSLQGSKLEGLKRFVSSHVSQFAEFAKLTVKQLMHFASSLGTKAVQAFLSAILQGRQVNSLPVADLVSQNLDRLAELFDSFGALAAQRVGDALQRGVALGSKIKQIAQQVTQVLDESRWRALAIADTELFKAFNAVLLSNYGANVPLVTGWWWHCQLNSRSCACCVALHGTIHPLIEILHDHPNGSCIALPYTVGMQPVQTGPEWFAQQDENVQRVILGTKVAYQLYMSGTPLQKFVGKNHDKKHGTSVYQRSAKAIKR